MTDVRKEKLNEKCVSKLIKRLLAKFKLSASAVPNTNKSTLIGQIRYLIVQRYELFPPISKPSLKTFHILVFVSKENS
jgi:hypothetical protein